ncbi:hypothetical protein HNY73_002836 [Argiope bruennichi]|uniref:Uncharacterized protein n=1 Tax=Argiope bruennichi TaxID=94029 RepID=A0A8T0FW61_ARGBR|nr:hypothetical protein HNY73_002836 [Argiope bruennichi]
MEMNLYHTILLLAIAALSRITRADENEEFISSLQCVASSGNQELCNQFLHCNAMMKQKYLDAYDVCLKEILPSGPRKCSENEHLYESEGTIRQDEGNWTMDAEMSEFKNCVNDLGKKCTVGSGN